MFISQTTYELYKGEIYEGYEMALKAGLHSLAHDLAVNELAPEVVLRNDMRLLRHIFARINWRVVDGWNSRGKVILSLSLSLSPSSCLL